MTYISSYSLFKKEMEAYPVDAGVVVVPTDLVLRARKITERFNEIIHYSEHSVYLRMMERDDLLQILVLRGIQALSYSTRALLGESKTETR